MDIRIRPARYEDGELLLSIMSGAYGPSGDEKDPEAWKAKFLAGHEKQFSEGFDPDHRPMIVSVDGEDVGRLRVVRRTDSIYLAGVQIHRSAQGRGIGTSLIERLIAESQASGLPLRLDVDVPNDRARALYERLGFEVTGEADGSHQMERRPS